MKAEILIETLVMGIICVSMCITFSIDNMFYEKRLNESRKLLDDIHEFKMSSKLVFCTIDGKEYPLAKIDEIANEEFKVINCYIK